MTSIISSIAWVQRGVAKATPDKVELSKEQLENLLKETEGNSEDVAGDGSDEEKEGDAEDTKDEQENSDELAEYNLDKYDEEPDIEGASLADALASLAVYADDGEDPYITMKDEDEEDIEDFTIKPTDNLILVGKAEKDYSNLEVYVYNESDDELYCHHDILLPAFPLAVEWMNFDPAEDKPGNFVAIGSMTPVIDIWDLDLVECLEPTFSLGTHKKKKKNKKSKDKHDGHTDAVLDLSWNKLVRNVIASASADHTVALWDMSTGKTVTRLKQHTDKVQTLQWHPFEAQSLLTGGFDKCVKVFDCRNPTDGHKSWVFDGEIERVLWNHFSPYNFLASTDQGFVYYVDVRQDKPLFTLSAHTDAVSGLTLSSQVPGCLVTTSADKSIKVWDIQDNKPECVISKDLKMGALNCVCGCPDSPFVMATGGEKEGLRVIDIMSYSVVSRHFGNREHLIVDTAVQPSSQNAAMATEDTDSVAKETDDTMETDSVDIPKHVSQVVGGTKKKKKRKKK
ncbi:periodic tryptophan protein 1 homolog [Glandiceps talaboti]